MGHLTWFDLWDGRQVAACPPVPSVVALVRCGCRLTLIRARKGRMGERNSDGCVRQAMRWNPPGAHIPDRRHCG